MCELYKLKNTSNLFGASVYSLEKYAEKIGTGICYFWTQFY
jgi:hypothetical protein